MKYVFSNDEGELIVATTLEEASIYHDCELGGSPLPAKGWSQIPDGNVIAIAEEDGKTVTKKTAREWADEYNAKTQIASTYW